ncbi:MAG: hypothetical protein WBP54_12410, partial [Pelodictyon phaeoclathratiforme]
MKIILRKTFLKDIQKVSEPQKSQEKLFLEELYASSSISESSHSIKRSTKSHYVILTKTVQDFADIFFKSFFISRLEFHQFVLHLV